jgi:uncharacterized protein YndB with AHSA1/START domain
LPTHPAKNRTDTASRIIDAAPAAIYGAFADARAVAAWLPPAHMSARVLEYDFREGGRYRIELRYDDPAVNGKTTSQTDMSVGRFVALEAGKRIVQSVEFESAEAAFAGEMRMTWSFEPVPAGTRVTVTAENVPPGITPEDHNAGMSSSLDNLARHLA